MVQLKLFLNSMSLVCIWFTYIGEKIAKKTLKSV
ncbi:unnamed protein product [Arabidopsis halleri]